MCNKHSKVSLRKICIVEECTSIAQRGGVCFRHGAKYKKKSCSIDGCTSRAIQGGVCQKHGAKVVVHLCNVEGCKNKRVQAGVCKKHGAVTSQTVVKAEVVEEEEDNDGDFEAITNAIGEATKASKNSGGQVKSVAV